MVAEDVTHQSAASDEPVPPAGVKGHSDTAPTSETTTGNESLSHRGTDLGFGQLIETLGADSLIGVEMGGVRIEAVIAEGGMGRVYRAEQREPRRTVAVKVMRPAPSRQAVSRFQREVDVLARLRHPAIAQVYLAGMHRIGGYDVRFFVMEYVPDAKTIVTYATANHLSERQRCELFVQACDAVAHGHGHRVVHRDIKPGNVLVDGAGHVKVIDFGVARLLDAGAAGATETGQFVGTRNAMSPEQFATDGRMVDARSDVYSLGVLLHQVFTGKLPYDIDETSLVATARIVEEAVPRRLPVSDRALRGMAVIADRCLAKKPDDRYRSAADVADDVRRVMAGEMPLALRQSRRAKLSWWVERHRGMIAVGAVIVGLLVASVVPRLISGRDTATPPGDFLHADGVGPTARFVNVSSGRTTPLDWVNMNFDREVSGLAPACFRLRRDGQPVAMNGLRLVGSGRDWKLDGMAGSTAEEGGYVLELLGDSSGPRDAAGRRLAEPARVAWRMPARRSFSFNLLDREWDRYVVTLEGVERYAEKHAGANVFIRPTASGQEGRAVLRFIAPFPIQDATLSATLGVWTTGDPFPYDPGAKAAIDVSRDGESWTTVVSLEANRGGDDATPRDVSAIVSGGKEVWVRARLTGTREWPGDGLIFSQFLRTDPQKPAPSFQLDLVGPHPPVIPEADD